MANSEAEEREDAEKSNVQPPTILGVPLPDNAYVMSLYSESTKLCNEVSQRINAYCPATTTTTTTTTEEVVDNNTDKQPNSESNTDKQPNSENNNMSAADDDNEDTNKPPSDSTDGDNEATNELSNDDSKIDHSAITAKEPDKDDDDNSIAVEAPPNVEDNGNDLARSLERLRGLTCVYDESKCNCGHTEAGETLNEVGRALAEIEVVKSLSRFLEADDKQSEAKVTEETEIIVCVGEEHDEGIEVPMVSQDDEDEEGIEVPLVNQESPKEADGDGVEEGKEGIGVLAETAPEEATCSAASVPDENVQDDSNTSSTVSVPDENSNTVSVPDDSNTVSVEEGQGKEGIEKPFTSKTDYTDLTEEVLQSQLSSLGSDTNSEPEEKEVQQEDPQNIDASNSNDGTSDEDIAEEEMLEKAIKLSLSKRSLE